MSYPNQGIPQPNFQQPQFQSPQFTQPYNPPASQPQFNQQQSQFSNGQQQPGPAPAPGDLSKAWDQGSRAGGYGPFVKHANQGDLFGGVVARDMTDGDVQPVRDPGNGTFKTLKSSGTPQYKFVIPVDVQPTQEYPEGKATLSTDKYRMHSAVVKEMIAQGYQPGEGLKAGDYIQVQRVADVKVGMGNPAHDFVVNIARGYALQGQGAEQANPTAASQVQATGNPGITTTSPVPPTTPSAPAAAATNQVPQIPGLTPEQAALVAQYTNQG